MRAAAGRLRMAGRTAWVTASVPKRLTSNWARHSSGVTSSTAPYCAIARVVDEGVDAAGRGRAPPRRRRGSRPASVTSSVRAVEVVAPLELGEVVAVAGRGEDPVAPRGRPRAPSPGRCPEEHPVTRITRSCGHAGMLPSRRRRKATQTGSADRAEPRRIAAGKSIRESRLRR